MFMQRNNEEYIILIKDWIRPLHNEEYIIMNKVDNTVNITQYGEIQCHLQI